MVLKTFEKPRIKAIRNDEHKIKLSDLNEKESATTETGDTCRLGTIVVANGTFAACEGKLEKIFF